MTLRTLNYGNYGIFLIMGNAGFCPSAVAEEPGSHKDPSNCSIGLNGKSAVLHPKLCNIRA